MKYEYRVITTTSLKWNPLKGPADALVEKALNELAGDGWRLVPTTVLACLIFEREIRGQ